MSLLNLFQTQTIPTTIPTPSTKTSTALSTRPLTVLRSDGDRIALAVQGALTEYLGRRNTTNGQMFVPALRGSYIKPPFQYVVFDDQRLHHFHRSQLIGQGALNTISSALFQAGLKSRAFGFMPEECDDLRAKLERENMLLPFGVTYIIPLAPLPMLASSSAPASARLPKIAPLDLGQWSADSAREASPRDKLLVPIGVSANGPVTIALPKSTHALLVGETQSGKTTGIHTALYALTQLNSPRAFQFVMASPKANESAFWNGSPHLWHEIVSDHTGLIDLMQRVNAEVERRSKVLAQPGKICSTLGEWHALCAPEERMPYLVVLVDETLDFLAAGKLGRDVASLLQSIVTKGLAYGVIVWLLTQHVRDESGHGIPRIIETQLRTRLIWRVADKYAAEQAGSPGAEDIPTSIPGRLIVRLHGRRETVQGYWVDKELLRQQANLFAQTQSDPSSASPQLSDQDKQLLTWAISEQGGQGYLSLADIRVQAGVGQKEGGRIGERFEREGWLEKDNQHGRKRKVTPKAIALLGGTMMA